MEIIKKSETEVTMDNTQISESKTDFFKQFEKFTSIEDIQNNIFIPGTIIEKTGEKSWKSILLSGNVVAVGDGVLFDADKKGIISVITSKYSHAKKQHEYKLVVKTESGDIELSAVRNPRKVGEKKYNDIDVYTLENPIQNAREEFLKFMPEKTPKAGWELTRVEFNEIKPNEEHRNEITFAIGRGHVVPTHVLAEYPDLLLKSKERYLEKPIAREAIKEALESGLMSEDVKSKKISLIQALWLCEQIQAKPPVEEYVRSFQMDKSEYNYIATIPTAADFIQRYMGTNIASQTDIQKRLEHYLFIPHHKIESIINDAPSSLYEIIKQNELPPNHEIYALIKEIEFYKTCNTLTNELDKDPQGLSLVDLSEITRNAVLSSYYEYALFLQKERMQDIRCNATEDLLNYAEWALKHAHTPLDAQDARGGRPEIWMIGPEAIQIPREMAQKLIEWRQDSTHISVMLSLPQNTEKNIMADTIGLSNEYNATTETAIKKTLYENAIKELQKQYFKKIVDKVIERGDVDRAIKEGRVNHELMKHVVAIYPQFEKSIPSNSQPVIGVSPIKETEGNERSTIPKEYWKETLEFWQKRSGIERKENSVYFSDINNKVKITITQDAGNGNEYVIEGGSRNRIVNTNDITYSLAITRQDETFINEAIAMGNCTIRILNTNQDIQLPHKVLSGEALKSKFIEEVMGAIDNGSIRKAIESKEVTALHMERVIKSANIRIPENILQLCENERALIERESNRIKVKPENIKYEDSKTISAIYSPKDLYAIKNSNDFISLKDIFKNADMFTIGNAFDATDKLPSMHERKKDIMQKKDITMYALLSSLNQKGILPGEALYLSKEAAEFYKNSSGLHVIAIEINPKDVIYDKETPQQFICAPEKPRQYFPEKEMELDRD